MIKFFLFLYGLAAVKLQAQNVGIGTTSPAARLHITDSAVLFSGAIAVPPVTTTINTPVQGAGTRTIWFPALGAFRTGYVNGVQWNKENIGQLSFAAGYNTTASGKISTAFGYGSTASGDSSTAFGSLTTASGTFSTAMGYFTAATSNFSTAMGIGSAATGYASTAMGYSTTAGGSFSTSLGNISNASGTVSLAVGEHTLAKAYGSVAMGMYNDSVDAPSATVPDAGDRIFQIGNGNGPGSGRSNAVTVLRNGNMGLGITSPLAKLDIRGQILLRGNGFQSDAPAVFLTNVNGDQFRGKLGKHPTNDSLIGLWGFYAPNNGWALNMNIYNGRIGIGTDSARAALHVADSAVLFTGPATFPQTTTITPPVQGPGTRMMWYAPKGAFRAGYAFGNEWDRDNIGILSFAAGYNAIAYGQQSFALGTFVYAGGTHSTALGVNGSATGYVSTKMGWATTASGWFSTAIGENTLAKAKSSFAVGQWNDNTDNPGENNPIPLDRLFQIGNGTADNARSNALTVLRNGNTGIGNTDPAFRLDISNRMRIRSGGDLNNSAGIWLNNIANTSLTAFAGMESDASVGLYGNSGAGWGLVMNVTSGNVGIGTTSPSQKLHVAGNICATGTIGACSDIRYKTNFSPVKNSLASVLSLHGIYYNWRVNEFPGMKFTNNRQLGFSAQEVEKLFPEVVMTDADGYKSLDYGRLTPVLVEAIKEQQTQINELKKLVQQLLNK